MLLLMILLLELVTLAPRDQMDPAHVSVLEQITRMKYEKAIEKGLLHYGMTIDFDSPGFRLVVAFNKWIEERNRLARIFEVDAFEDQIDYQEILAFRAATERWDEYEASVEAAYKEFKKAKKAWRKLEKAFDEEKKGR